MRIVVVDERLTPPIRLVIEIYAGHEPIEGAVVEPAAHAAPFRGWLALTGLIESARRCTEHLENAVGERPTAPRSGERATAVTPP